jgi:crotonobetainyl-CoA:carnitine CoA-transferase CaiB-like acyl-CoA transferase
MTMNTSESITPEHVGSSDDEAQPVRPGPVAGLRVLDLGTVYAAPITAMLLGDWGADVVIENGDKLDELRENGVV